MPQTATPAPPLLSAQALRFTRNDMPVFGPIDFEVAAGEALLIQGDNGAGKTTLLKVLAGLLPADGGELRLRGQRVDPGLRARVVGYLGHLPAQKADLSALENLRFLCGLHGSRPGISLEDAMAKTALRTRQLAKRQMTWFCHQANVVWISVTENSTIEQLAGQVLAQWKQYGPTPVIR